jgi:hypothetical protein
VAHWCEVDKQLGLGVLEEHFEAAVAHGLIAPQPIESLAQLFLGALNVGGRVIAEAADPRAARKEVGATIDRLLSGLLEKRKSRRG